MVLNEINNITINGLRISVDLKQRIYEDLFMQKKKITRKKLVDYLISNGVIEKGQEDLISGIDTDIHSTYLRRLLFVVAKRMNLSERKSRNYRKNVLCRGKHQAVTVDKNIQFFRRDQKIYMW